MRVGDRCSIMGPIKWLAQVGLVSRLGQRCILIKEEPVDFINLDGESLTPVFRVKFMDSQAHMFHHVPGPCLKNIEEDFVHKSKFCSKHLAWDCNFCK